MKTRKKPTKAELRKRVLRAASRYEQRWTRSFAPVPIRHLIRAVRAARRGGAVS